MRGDGSSSTPAPGTNLFNNLQAGLLSTEIALLSLVRCGLHFHWNH